ncbi:MAG: hypothetical protein JO138_18800 [Acidobacteriaceae bacterium]|nr:hypothetical protein [Acidobacteriaceae bacterium]
MPFDCSPVLDLQQRLLGLTGDTVENGAARPTPKPIRFRPMPPWRICRRAESAEAALAVLVRARELIAAKQRWCKRSTARGWLDIPVPVRSRFARRFCAIGAVQRAARELRLPFHEAGGALEWQTIRPIPDWNDDAVRTHAEVVAAFDAAIVALQMMPV